MRPLRLGLQRIRQYRPFHIDGTGADPLAGVRARGPHLSVLIALFIAGAASCRSDTPTSPDERTGELAQIELTPDSVTLESIGDSVVFTATPMDSNGHVVADTKIIWVLDTVGVVSLEKGMVVAMAPGVRLVTARARAASGRTVSASATVMVVPRTRELTLLPSADTIGLGGRLGFYLESFDARGHPTELPAVVTWISSDTTVATIDDEGEVIARGLGETVIAADTGHGAILGHLVVTAPSQVRVSAGALDSCALSASGEAWCWGFNDQGQLGTRASTDICTAGPVMGSYPCSFSPVKVDGGFSFRMTANGFEHTCALDFDGRAYCWGANDYGQLGTDATGDTCHPAVFGGEVPCSYVPLPVATETRFVSIGAGYRTTCALGTDQRVYCWGNNEQGSEGLLADHPDIREPTEVAGGLRYKSLSVGWLHACAVVVDGSTRCWGFNMSGQLGDGGWQPRFAPTPLDNDPGFVLLAAGKEHTCGLAADQSAYCWGQEVGFKPTGRFASNWESAPLPTVDRTPMDTLASGAAFSCGIFADDIVRCWGDNTWWQLGGLLPGGYPVNVSSDTPVPIQLNATFSMIATGFAHACGVRTGGAVYCWGDGVEGELGDGEPHEYAGPQEVTRPVRISLPFR